jgi:plasmid rolling circle replication initiator protein Rep
MSAIIAPRDNMSLSDYSEKDAKWDNHRAKTQDIEGIYAKNPTFHRLASRMSSCADLLRFAAHTNHETGEHGIRLRSAQFCKVRHCPVCEWRRSMKNTARFFTALPEILRQYPTHRFLFLTLTVKNCAPDQLRATLADMSKAWQRMSQRKDFPAVGFIRSTEVTRSKTGQAHPHYHCILMVKSSYFGAGYIKKTDWALRWQSALRVDYLPVVDVRKIEPKQEGQTIEGAIVETLKYSIKVEDALQNPQWLYTITEQLHKLRFLATGGVLKGILKEKMTDSEMVQGDESDDKTKDDDAPSLVFKWRRPSRKYMKVNYTK